MRLKFILSLLYAWLLWLPWGGAQASAQPSPVRSPDILDGTTSDQAQITAGDLLLKDRAFKEAEAAYAKALQSMDRSTREKALHSLERSLRHRHDFSVLTRETLHGSGESVIRALPLVLFFFVLFSILWWIVGWWGKRAGSRRCVLEDIDKATPGFAKTFHLAYLKALEERRNARSPRAGALGSRSIAPRVEVIPTIERAMEETALAQLMFFASPDAGRITSVFMSRFRRPRLRLRVALQDDAPLTLVSLEDNGTTVQVWSEPLDILGLFKPRCVLLREIMTYIEKKISSEQ